jgi:tRNA A37 methylthiotransferase MiaB
MNKNIKKLKKTLPLIYFKDNTCSNYKLQIGRFRDYFISNGWKETNDPKKAGIIFIGTCAAFDILEKESLQDLKIMNKLSKESGRQTQVIAYGCLVGFNKKGVKKVHHGLSIPTWRVDEVESLIKDPKVRIKDIPLKAIFRQKEDYRLYNPAKRFVSICLGCPFNCTYCPHKLGIGPLRSRPFKEIVGQIQDSVKEKVKTIVLVGNEVGAYGIDIGTTYPKLLRRVMDIGSSFDIHVSQLHPAWALKYRKELLPLLSNTRVSDIQIPIQTTSKRLLRLMKRPESTEKVLDFLQLIRKRNKRAVFRTDIMVGFPTETMEELRETLKAATGIFDEITVYGFERKKGVPLEKMGLKFYTPKEVGRHVDFALKFASKKDCLITRGGQVPIKEMKKADLRKAKLYKIRSSKINGKK